MTINIFHDAVPNEARDQFDVILGLPKKGVRLGFVGNLVRPTKEGKVELTTPQKVRSLKFFEVITTVEMLVGSTDASTIFIRRGTMIGTFLMMRLVDAVKVNYRFHGFEKSEWKHLNDVTVDGCDVTIHVFAGDQVDEEIEAGGVEVVAFHPKQRFNVPRYAEEAVNLENDLSLSDREGRILSYKFQTMVDSLVKLGVEAIAVSHASVLPRDVMPSFIEKFASRVKTTGFPEGYFGNPASKQSLAQLKQRFQVGAGVVMA